MATRPATMITNANGVTIITWEGLLNGDDGEPVDMSRFSHISIQASGTFGTGGNVQVQGRNVGTGAFGIMQMGTSNGFGDANLSDSRMRALWGTTLSMRPNVTAGDGTTDLTVVATALRQ